MFNIEIDYDADVDIDIGDNIDETDRNYDWCRGRTILWIGG